jgi:hypothetical protein
VHDFGYGDYSGLAFANGRLFPAWADNSTALENPFLPAFDLASANLAVIDVSQAGVVKEVPVTANVGPEFTSVVARFNDFRGDATAGEFTATIDWGDGTISSGTVSLDPTLNDPHKLDPVFDVTGTHTFDKPGAYRRRAHADRARHQRHGAGGCSMPRRRSRHPPSPAQRRKGRR